MIFQEIKYNHYEDIIYDTHKFIKNLIIGYIFNY